MGFEQFSAIPLEITPEMVQNNMKTFRRCQIYLACLPESKIKSDLIDMINLANDLICETAYEHGADTAEKLMQIEKAENPNNIEFWIK